MNIFLLAGFLEYPLQGLTAAKQQRSVIAEHFAEAARQDEVALHVDDDERRGLRIELEREGFCLD